MISPNTLPCLDKELILGMIHRISRIITGIKLYRKVRLTLLKNDEDVYLIEILNGLDFQFRMQVGK